CQQYNDLLLTF
nr:immunoglobulin light chain junction region [Macaca mulatta]MOV76028.1 immunoglobulin light chain junction region [Macaca mulatta]MOW07886.1 immunoglobulin light chain junction region [Macaca mulatta]MOW07992.1 immunoglobulin light chain junction region [Macaca mulatta]MOW08120.1 immunoglobulin light chain junction region [Macaca mulatta]